MNNKIKELQTKLDSMQEQFNAERSNIEDMLQKDMITTRMEKAPKIPRRSPSSGTAKRVRSSR